MELNRPEANPRALCENSENKMDSFDECQSKLKDKDFELLQD